MHRIELFMVEHFCIIVICLDSETLCGNICSVFLNIATSDQLGIIAFLRGYKVHDRNSSAADHAYFEFFHFISTSCPVRAD